MSTLHLYAPCPLNMADSYGLLSAMLARHLARTGVYVNLHAFGGTLHPSLPEDIAAIARQGYREATGGIFIGYPTNYVKHDPIYPGPSVAITMFESSRIPEEWVPALNAMDAVIVPSQMCAEAFGESGVYAPIHVVPLGINDLYRYAERPQDRPLTFLAFKDRGPRKGGELAEQAFLIAFGERTDVHLLLKARKPRRYVEYTNRNMTLIQKDMTEAELYQFYLSADVMINPNKGEGFGLLPREFAATGGVALATNWGGTADDLEKWGWPLPYWLETAHWEHHRHFAGRALGEWAYVSPHEVARLLLHVVEHWPIYHSQTRTKAEFAASYTWERFAAQVLTIWKGVVDATTRHRLHAA